jgi:hypothetical protein
MARIRSVKPEFWTDEKVVELSAFARLLFIGLWNFADDDGRMVHSPKRIKMQVLPADDIDCSGLLGEIQRASLVNVYVVDGIEYLQINGFAKHQKIDKRSASRLPPPPNSAESRRIPTTDQGRDQGMDQGGEGKEDTPVSPSPAGDDLFDSFWSEYPKKVGKDDARKAWKKRKVSQALAEQMIAAVRVQRGSQQWAKDGGQYIPNPSTWINQGRWQDEAPAAKTSRTGFAHINYNEGINEDGTFD